MSKVSKVEVKRVLRTELEGLARKGYAIIERDIDSYPLSYEITNDLGSYQIQINASKDSKTGLINVFGSIDGPGVFHFLGYVSSVTDFFSIDPKGVVEYKL